MEVWISRGEIAWLASSPGRISLTAVWISRDEIVGSPGRISLTEVWILRCEIAWLASPPGRISLMVVWISRDEVVSSPGRMSLTEVWILQDGWKSQSKQQRVLQNRKEHVRRSKIIN